MWYFIEIVPSAVAELQQIAVFWRRRIVRTIDDLLASQPFVPTWKEWGLRPDDNQQRYNVKTSVFGATVRTILLEAASLLPGQCPGPNNTAFRNNRWVAGYMARKFGSSVNATTWPLPSGSWIR
jgi:hypothetical protein